LYDVAADPAERENLASSKGSTASSLAAWLERATKDAPVAQPATATADADTKERVRALGYATSSPQPLPSARTTPDPKDKLGTNETPPRAQGLAAEGRDGDVVTMLQPMVAAEPRMLDAWELMAKSLVRTGRTREAIDAFGRVLAIEPMKPE